MTSALVLKYRKKVLTEMSERSAIASAVVFSKPPPSSPPFSSNSRPASRMISLR
jgi:hypothetical protein